ncbi:MAG TPA: DUF4365 domain-containing protein [Acidimicrobiales bacterium]|nr:DUF4365 domain-containing protein [Acidimicrobiales bacterium]
MAKRYTKQAQSGEGGMALISMRVTAMGLIWHARRTDHGIDGEIELVAPTDRRPLNRVIAVQSKARERFPGEDEQSFHFDCDRDDLAYWAEANVPVIVVFSHPKTGEAWWASITAMLRDPMRRASRRLHIDKQRDRFDASATARLLDLAIPPSGGLYVPTPRKRETLTSNLLAVDRLPQTIWAAPSTVPGNREAREVLRRHHVHSVNWMVLDGTVFSFDRTADGLPLISDGPPEEIDSAEWALTKSSDVYRHFVRLLNQTLIEMHHRELRRHPKGRYLYFRPTSDLRPRNLSTGKSKSGRVVFRAYPHAHAVSEAKHFRHHAVDHQFVRLDGQWFLELNPTYHFTTNGYQDLPWGADYVKGMKRLEKNSAVCSLVEMWAHYFRGTNELLAGQASELSFGNLQAFEVANGLDDRSWRSSDSDKAPTSDAPALFEAS